MFILTLTYVLMDNFLSLFSCYFTFKSYIFCLPITTFFSFLSFFYYILSLYPLFQINFLSFCSLPFQFTNNNFLLITFSLYVPFNFVYIYPCFFELFVGLILVLTLSSVPIHYQPAQSSINTLHLGGIYKLILYYLEFNQYTPSRGVFIN